MDPVFVSLRHLILKICFTLSNFGSLSLCIGHFVPFPMVRIAPPRSVKLIFGFQFR